jgi:hypothetical protein
MARQIMGRKLLASVTLIAVVFAFVESVAAESLWDVIAPSRAALEKTAANEAPPIPVSMFVIAFYVVYLCTIWAFNIAMLRALSQLPPANAVTGRHIAVANTLLAAGDTGMFIAWAVIYFTNPQLKGLLDTNAQFSLVILGIFSTSLTMSCYYLYIAFYYRDKFAGGRQTVLMSVIVAFFIARLLLHYNPQNIWLSMMLPPGTPNQSSWLRNIPLFIYGLLAVVLILVCAIRNLRGTADSLDRKLYGAIVLAMLALVLSFIFYAVDVFFGHRISEMYIWITYTAKTIAYVAALMLLWYAEFYLPRTAVRA